MVVLGSCLRAPPAPRAAGGLQLSAKPRMPPGRGQSQDPRQDTGRQQRCGQQLTCLPCAESKRPAWLCRSRQRCGMRWPARSHCCARKGGLPTRCHARQQPCPLGASGCICPHGLGGRIQSASSSSASVPPWPLWPQVPLQHQHAHAGHQQGPEVGGRRGRAGRAGQAGRSAAAPWGTPCGTGAWHGSQAVPCIRVQALSRLYHASGNRGSQSIPCIRVHALSLAAWVSSEVLRSLATAAGSCRTAAPPQPRRNAPAAVHLPPPVPTGGGAAGPQDRG